MKPYTETQLQLNFSSWRICRKIDFSSVESINDTIHKAYNEGARYVEAELLPVIANQHVAIEGKNAEIASLRSEINQLKDKIVKLTGNE